MSQSAVLLLGSNLGKREEHLRKASQQIADQIGAVEAVSSIYESSPWGNSFQDPFLNQVMRIQTILPAEEVLRSILKIERELGRVRNEKWGPRIIDIDILYYNDLIINSDELEIPHPGIPQRRFTLIPLIEIMPSFVHPALRLTHTELLMQCLDQGLVTTISNHDK